MFSMEVTRNKILICLLLIKTIRNFKVIELPPNIVQLHLYLANHVVLHNGTQLEGEKCKFQKLQNKDHPKVECKLFTSIFIFHGSGAVKRFVITTSVNQTLTTNNKFQAANRFGIMTG